MLNFRPKAGRGRGRARAGMRSRSPGRGRGGVWRSRPVRRTIRRAGVGARRGRTSPTAGARRCGLARGEVDVGAEAEPGVVGVLPVVVAAPVAVEVEVSEVVGARVVAERLPEDGREAGGDLPLARRASPRGRGAL